MDNMKRSFFIRLMRIIFKKPVISGVDKIDLASPAIFVSNHLGAYGPIVLTLFLPFRLFAWVTHEITDYRLCAKYLKKDFIESELKLKPPFSNIIASIIGPICVLLMKFLKVIPVYKNSPKLRLTFAESVKALKSGRYLLIFPEISETPGREAIKEFNSGFINIARKMFEESGIILNFYPVSVNKTFKTIRIGEKIPFDPGNSPELERQRIITRLREDILEMYHNNNGLRSKRHSRTENLPL